MALFHMLWSWITKEGVRDVSMMFLVMAFVLFGLGCVLWNIEELRINIPSCAENGMVKE